MLPLGSIVMWIMDENGKADDVSIIRLSLVRLQKVNTVTWRYELL